MSELDAIDSVVLSAIPDTSWADAVEISDQSGQPGAAINDNLKRLRARGVVRSRMFDDRLEWQRVGF